jgi:hypothetical protein
MVSSTASAARLRNIMAVGRKVFSEAENTGTSTGKPPASQTPCLHPFSQFAQVAVARREFRPSVEDADHRTTVEHVVGIALVLHPAAVVDLVGRFRRYHS